MSRTPDCSTTGRPIADEAPAADASADSEIGVLAELMQTLMLQGGVSLQLAASWIAEPDDALDGISPAMWVAAERDLDRLRTVCRQDAARLAR